VEGNIFDVLDDFGTLDTESITEALLRTPGLRERLGEIKVCLLRSRS
jgi:hypothetical protein